MDYPTTFNYTEQDLDTHFIGQWDIHNVDDYGTIKAGTHSRSAVVRSKINLEHGTITLVSILSTRYGVTDIIIDGSIGLYGKITERARSGDDDNKTLVRAEFGCAQLLSSEKLREECHKTTDGYRVWRGTFELDDIVFNMSGRYSYPMYYFAKGNHLVGMQLEMPIKDFNHYVHMRDLWYRDYRGTKEIHPRDA